MPFCTECRTIATGNYCTGCGRQFSANAPAPPRAVQAVSALVSVESRTPPGYVPPISRVPTPSMGATDNNHFTSDAECILQSTGERIAWQGKPSMMLLIPRVAAWTAVLFLASSWALSSRSGWAWVLLWMSCAAMYVGGGYLRLRSTMYRISSQRLEITSGLLNTNTETINLMAIGQVRIENRFPWSLFGIGDLVLDASEMSAENGSGNLRLVGIRNLSSVRDLIHSSSNIMGQLWDERRFGPSPP